MKSFEDSGRILKQPFFQFILMFLHFSSFDVHFFLFDVASGVCLI